MNIAVQGCCHGELDQIYAWIANYEKTNDLKVDLLLCCGDFQAIRHEHDLNDLSCPPKYRDYRDFKEYFNGQKVAPVLTVFIGGNHEAPDFLKDLYYGGWVAPNIYYLGHSGVINVEGIRIAGVSGIYNPASYTKGYFESNPYNEDTKRSAYHTREFDIKKLSLIQDQVDIFLSHDWPAGIEHHGDLDQLLRIKPFFYEDIRRNTLGNPKTKELLDTLKPKYWFSAHLHVMFEAEYKHNDGSKTFFLALDKVLPYREFIRVFESFPNPNFGIKRKRNDDIAPVKLCYDREWCAILVANRDKMPLNAFPSDVPITLNEPSKLDYKFVDNQFLDAEYETFVHDDAKYFVIPYTNHAHLDPKSQREAFMTLLGLPDNSFFSPGIEEKLEVNLLD